MKFACVADTHSYGPPNLEGPFDAWLHAGDIYDGRKKSFHKGWFDIEKLYIVHGNHDCNDHHGIFKKYSATGLVTPLAPKLFLVGIGWTGEQYFELPTEECLAKCCQEVLRQCMFKMKNGDQSIVLTHYCALNGAIYCKNPLGWFSSNINSVIDAIRPLVVIQGHKHSLAGKVWRYNNTIYINPGNKGMCLNIDEKWGITIS